MALRPLGWGKQSKGSVPVTPAMGWCECHSQKQAPKGLDVFLGEIPACNHSHTWLWLVEAEHLFPLARAILVHRHHDESFPSPQKRTIFMVSPSHHRLLDRPRRGLVGTILLL